MEYMDLILILVQTKTTLSISFLEVSKLIVYKCFIIGFVVKSFANGDETVARKTLSKMKLMTMGKKGKTFMDLITPFLDELVQQ